MSSRSTIIIIGSAAGALLGATAAWVYVNAKEGNRALRSSSGRELKVQAGVPDLVRIGIALLTVMRQIADLVT